MKDALYLAWRYVAYHRVKSAILIASITLIIFLPVGLNVLVNQSAEQLTARAEATPLLLGCQGKPPRAGPQLPVLRRRAHGPHDPRRGAPGGRLGSRPGHPALRPLPRSGPSHRGHHSRVLRLPGSPGSRRAADGHPRRVRPRRPGGEAPGGGRRGQRGVVSGERLRPGRGLPPQDEGRGGSRALFLPRRPCGVRRPQDRLGDRGSRPWAPGPDPAPGGRGGAGTRGEHHPGQRLPRAVQRDHRREPGLLSFPRIARRLPHHRGDGGAPRREVGGDPPRAVPGRRRAHPDRPARSRDPRAARHRLHRPELRGGRDPPRERGHPGHRGARAPALAAAAAPGDRDADQDRGLAGPRGLPRALGGGHRVGGGRRPRRWAHPAHPPLRLGRDPAVLLSWRTP